LRRTCLGNEEIVVLGFFFDPRGRLDRRSYLAAVIGLMIVAVFLTGLARGELVFTPGGAMLDNLWDASYGAYGRELDEIAARSWVSLSAVLAVHGLVALSFLSLSARRLQDMGRPGVYAALFPVVGAAVFAFILAVLPGDKQENAHGPAKTTRGDAQNGASA
jgi:uncharacterized membrane protein YhaH (DUF805 family)